MPLLTTKNAVFNENWLWRVIIISILPKVSKWTFIKIRTKYRITFFVPFPLILILIIVIFCVISTNTNLNKSKSLSRQTIQLWKHKHKLTSFLKFFYNFIKTQMLTPGPTLFCVWFVKLLTKFNFCIALKYIYSIFRL